jgi:hypothetical protein
MNPDDAASVLSAAGRRRRRVVIAVASISLLVGCAGLLIVQDRRASAARLREARAVAAIRSLGGEIVDRPVEFLPFGRVFPGSVAAPLRLVIKLRAPGVTDDRLAVLDDLAADRVSDLDVIDCAAGDATLARAGRFRELTLLGLGQARHSKDEPWPTGPTGLLTEAGFAHLDRLADLEIVGLHGPDVTDAALAHLRGARNLRILILYGSRVTGAGLAALGPKPGLSTLKLGGTRFGDDDLAALAQFPSLETLDLRETGVTDSGLPRLRGLTRLKSLSLAGCAVGDAAVAELIRARPGLAVEHAASSPPPRGTTR